MDWLTHNPIADMYGPHFLLTRGREYLQQLQLAFERLKERYSLLSRPADDPNLLLLVGLFGVGVLAGIPYGPYQQMFRRAASTGESHGWNFGSWDWGSCGGGCGSCGGGGGGGCGGCGSGGD